MSGYPPKFIENIIGIVVDIEQVKINFVIKGRLFIYIVKISKNINKKIKFMCCVDKLKILAIKGVRILCGYGLISPSINNFSACSL